MLTSDSDDDIFLAIAVETAGANQARSRPGPSHSVSSRANSSTDEEPPRRRRRIEDIPDESPISHRTRTRNATSVSDPVEPPRIDTGPGEPSRNVSNDLPGPSSRLVTTAAVQSTEEAPPADNEVIVPNTHELRHNYPPIRFSTDPNEDSDNSDDDDLISLSSFVSHSNSIIFVDSDEDSAEDHSPSFEVFDLDDLSDVEVPHGSSSDEANHSESSEPSEDDGSDSSETPPGSAEFEAWRDSRSRERRNAIVDQLIANQPPGLDNTVPVPNGTGAPLPAEASESRVVSASGDAASTNCPDTADNVEAARLNESVRSDDEEGLTCVICYESFTNSGEHRICCLKCGHTYGKICIERWIKTESRCPQCNSKATKRDIRVLYVKNLKALDTSERDSVLARLDQEQELKRKLELECARLRQMNQHKDTAFKLVSEELAQLKAKCGSVYRDSSTSSQQPSTSTALCGAPSNVVPGQLQFSRVTSFDFQAECRVGAYNEWYNMLVVSQNVKSALYPQGMFGIRRVNLLDMKLNQQTPIHQKEIRDLEFSPHQSDILLSVGMDKKASLTDVRLNVSVQTYNADYPLWSCAWSSVSQHLFYAGSSNGMLLTYDLRNPNELASSALVTNSDTSTPLAGICFVPPSYQKSTSPTSSGILVQRFNSVWFGEFRNDETKFHQLPVEGCFQSLGFEPKSRHALFSTRQTASNPARHMVCDLNQYYSEAQDTNVCSCNIVQTFTGSMGLAGKLCRSSIFSPVDGKVLVAANGPPGSANMWDVSDPSWKHTLPVNGGQILDIVPCSVNNNYLLNMINGSGVGIYGIHS